VTVTHLYDPESVNESAQRRAPPGARRLSAVRRRRYGLRRRGSSPRAAEIRGFGPAGRRRAGKRTATRAAPG